MREEEYYRLRLRTLSTSACVICGFQPKLPVSRWRKAIKKQALGAHFRRHWREVSDPTTDRPLPWFCCPVVGKDFREMFDADGKLRVEIARKIYEVKIIRKDV